jgi:hypothetical protein
MKHLRIVTMVGLLSAVSLAQIVQPTVSGVVQSVSGGIVRIRNEETGTVWTGRLEPNAKMETSLTKGKKVAMRIRGGLSEKPLRVDLVTDWGNSSKYVATAAPAPYMTKQGEWVGPGGVGGRPPNAPDPGKTKNVAAYAANGGMPHQNPQGVPNLMAPAAQDPGAAKMSKGTPGFQAAPVAPDAPPPAEPQPGSTGVSNTIYPNGDPNTPVYPGMNPGMNQPYPGMGMNQPYPGMNPNMPPGMNQPMPPGLENFNQPNFNNPSANNLESLLNGSEEGATQEQQGNSMFPGMGGPTAMQGGAPVQMQATVLRSDPATRSMVVMPVGTQTTQNIMLSPQMMLPTLRQGQMVTITGTSNPNGFIEAQQVTPYGP